MADLSYADYVDHIDRIIKNRTSPYTAWALGSSGEYETATLRIPPGLCLYSDWRQTLKDLAEYVGGP